MCPARSFLPGIEKMDFKARLIGYPCGMKKSRERKSDVAMKASSVDPFVFLVSRIVSNSWNLWRWNGITYIDSSITAPAFAELAVCNAHHTQTTRILRGADKLDDRGPLRFVCVSIVCEISVWGRVFL